MKSLFHKLVIGFAIIYGVVFISQSVKADVLYDQTSDGYPNHCFYWKYGDLQVWDGDCTQVAPHDEGMSSSYDWAIIQDIFTNPDTFNPWKLSKVEWNIKAPTINCSLNANVTAYLLDETDYLTWSSTYGTITDYIQKSSSVALQDGYNTFTFISPVELINPQQSLYLIFQRDSGGCFLIPTRDGYALPNPYPTYNSVLYSSRLVANSAIHTGYTPYKYDLELKLYLSSTGLSIVEPTELQIIDWNTDYDISGTCNTSATSTNASVTHIPNAPEYFSNLCSSGLWTIPRSGDPVGEWYVTATDTSGLVKNRHYSILATQIFSSSSTNPFSGSPFTPIQIATSTCSLPIANWSCDSWVTGGMDICNIVGTGISDTICLGITSMSSGVNKLQKLKPYSYVFQTANTLQTMLTPTSSLPMDYSINFNNTNIELFNSSSTPLTVWQQSNWDYFRTWEQYAIYLLTFFWFVRRFLPFIRSF